MLFCAFRSQPEGAAVPDLKSLIRTIPDYPKTGIMFRDVTTLLGDAQGFKATVEQMAAPFAGFRLVVRGLDPYRRGFAATPWSLTVDGGCGFGGRLIGLCLAPGGEILDRIEA